MKRLLGVFTFLFGMAILVWIGYNLLIERQPEFKGPVLLGIASSVSLMGWGVNWMRAD